MSNLAEAQPKTRLTTLDMLERLVGFDTTSRNSNLPLIDFVRDYLGEYGIDSRLTFDETGKKANLFATIGPADRPGIILSGHSDVVPVDGQDWSTDPFRLTERDGRVYGRGTADMKGFVAAMLAMVPRFAESPLKAPVHLAISYDEEIGCIGVRGLIADLGHLAHPPRACIVGEPTSMTPVVAHKGKVSAECRVIGRECHSSLAPRGVNAVQEAAELIVELRRRARRFQAEGPFDEGFDIPHTTVHTGTVEGGTALNIVPRECRFRFEFRALPEEDPARYYADIRQFAETERLPEMRAVAPESGFEWTELSTLPALSTAEDAEVTALAKALSGSNRTGKVAFGTEGGLFQNAGVPAIVCGPGSIDQAHQPDEFIEIDQLRRCDAFLERFLDHMCRD